MTENPESNLPPARILIVDDHPNTAAMLARVLGNFDTPVEVITACSGEDALQQIGSRIVDVLITDFMMPGISGLELIEKLKERHEPAHTILITAYDTPGLSMTSQRLGVQNYLVKPVDPEKIRSIISEVLKDILPYRMASRISPQKRPFKILIADDYPDNVRLLAIRLGDEGYEYITASDGVEALQQLREHKPDLALLDVNMPNKDGFQVLVEMRADPELAHIPAIIVTAARVGVKDVREGLTLGADDYVTKPVDWRELAARIRTKLRVKQAEDTLRNRAENLSVLPEISKDLSERLDIEALTRTILTHTVPALEATNGHLVIFHPDGSVSYQIHEKFDYSPWAWEDLKQNIVGKGIVPDVVFSRQGRVIGDTVGEENWLEIPNDTARSAIAIPLLARREVLGVLTLTHKKEGHFKSDQLNLLGAIASQAAIAVENAQLYAVERKRVNELVALNQLTREINQFTSSSALIKGLPDLVNQSFGYPTVALWEEAGANLILQSISGKEDAFNTVILETGPRQAILTGQPAQLSGTVNGYGDGANTPAIQSVIAVPLFWDNKVSGALSIYSHRASAFKESDRVVLETLAIQYQSALERIQLFESVEQEKKRMDAVLQAAADAILLIDENGNLQLVNLAGERLFTDVETRLSQPLPRGRGYDSLINLLEEAAKTGETSINEIDWPDQRTFSALTTPIENGGLVIMLHDVTHFKDMERVKNEFIATASHDLKNPIHSVMGYSDLLIKAGPLNDTQKDFVVRLQRASTQMYELVLNLLEMARMDLDPTLKLQRYDAQTLLIDVIQEFQTQAGAKRQTLTSLMPKEGDHQVDVDLPRIRQVVRNLMANAVKYTPENGEITLSTSHQDSTLWVHVRDNGLGIPEKDLVHIFEKFYRVESDDREDIQGNGLGLAIVKAIVEEHGGEVSVESVFGEGSCFSFSLPLASNPEI